MPQGQARHVWVTCYSTGFSPDHPSRASVPRRFLLFLKPSFVSRHSELLSRCRPLPASALLLSAIQPAPRYQLPYRGPLSPQPRPGFPGSLSSLIPATSPPPSPTPCPQGLFHPNYLPAPTYNPLYPLLSLATEPSPRVVRPPGPPRINYDYNAAVRSTTVKGVCSEVHASRERPLGSDRCFLA